MIGKTFERGEILTADDVNDYINPETAENVPARMAAGIATVAFSGQTQTVQTVTFPAGRFSTAPIITLTAATYQDRVLYNVHAASASGFTIVANTANGAAHTNAALKVQWIAVQMKPNAAAG